MHGARGGEEDCCKRRRHMLPVPSPAPGAPTSQPQPSAGASPPAVNFSEPIAVQNASDCFLKDGRRIQVGDCALFQAGNAPPFIGIIRRFSTSKENHLKLYVNWLYRPADVKLAKGVLEAAPNEVFYSFHRDVISAVSLLHPCKVAFLRKGVELPPGLSSFVCRRVYDIENKCLWWLTDQDYINELQEEVDQLLDRTRLEMNVVQPGGRSPKPLNGTASTQQLKSGSDSVQNSGTSFSSQGKGKKRDRGDQGTEPIKRERSAKMEDVDNASSRTDSPVKAEVAKITEKVGLFTLDGVEKLVDLMQRDRAEKKMDLTDRMLLAGVIAATDNTDCLVKFVQLRGVPVLDDWLQEVHRGKSGDGSSPKESDKAVEVLVLTLLRALDKLPVNLNALQTCNIGKSVNHLRSHKNLEIQKKARSLVDTWKKRVDLEIKNHDAKNAGSSQVPWPGKSSYSEVANAGNRRGGSTEMAMKSSATQPSIYRSLSGKAGHSDVIMKSTPVTVGSLKLQAAATATIAVGTKDLLLKAAGSSGTPELPQPKVKEEKSSSSSQSQNNSQSCSSDHAKTISSSWKEDAKSSTAGSMNASKASGGSSRHKRPSNGVLGTSISGVQKDTSFGKSGSLNRATTLDKVSHSGLICESTVDMRVSDHGNGHRFILKLPNMGRSTALNGNRGTLEDQSVVGSRASSPVTSDKHDNKIKVKNEPCWSNIAVDVSTEKWHNNDCKEGLHGSDEGEPSPTAILDEDRSADEPEKATNVPRSACSTSGNEKGVLLVEPKARNSFGSMNALIESCADYSEANVPLSAGDDVGMNLLATVAAGEMSQSPRRSPAREDPCGGNDESNLRSSCDGGKTPNLQSVENTDIDSENLAKTVGSTLTKDELQLVATDISGDNVAIWIKENKLTGEENGQHSVSGGYTNKTADSSVKSEGKQEGAGKCFTACAFSDTKEELDHNGVLQHQDKQNAGELVTESPMNSKLKVKGSTVDENKSINSHEKVVEKNMYTSDFNRDSAGVECHGSTHSSRNPQNLVAEGLSSCPPVDIEMLSVGTSTEQQQSMVDSHAENAERMGDVASGPSGVDKSESVDLEARNSILQIGHLEPDDTEQNKPATHVPKIIEGDPGTVLPSASNMGAVGMNLDRKEALDNHPAGSGSRESSPSPPVEETDKCIKSSASKLSVADIDKDAFSPSPEAPSKVVFESEVAVKLDFDLNEGIPGDDGNQNEQAASVEAVCSSSMHLPCLPSFSSSPIANGSSAIITVAAPAKGPFVPPENLLRSKAEPGWKGSAATSAFRPAEPRKVLEMPLAADVLSSGTASEKHGRVPLDIDLNVADDRVLDDMDSQSSAQTMGSESGAISNRDASVRSSGGLDLDLNKVDEGTENSHLLASTSRKFDAPLLPVRPASGGFPGGEANMLRDFDLNNGPNIDEVGTESLARSQHAKSNTSVPFLPPVAGLRMNTAEFGSVSSWFPPGNSYPAVAIPSFLSDRGEQPYPIVAAAGTQRILGSVSGGGTFGGDIYKGPVLQSSPAMAFSHGTAFPYAGFPFGSSFPVASTPFSGVSTTYVDSTSGGGPCFPAIPSQLVGPAGAVSASYPRPYMLSHPEGNIIGGSESSRKWGRQALDLNAGPGSAEMDGKDDRLAAASRQLYVANSQGFAEEQPRTYQVAGGGLKRKDPEAGLDAERYAYKQRTWQ